MNASLVHMTLVFVRNNDRILLGMKKRGFGKDKWNGFGGKVIPDRETVSEAAVRELREECGISVDVNDLKNVGELYYEFIDVDMPNTKVHVYEVSKYNNDPIETEEMSPSWFQVEDLPFDNMWIDDRLWIPFYLQKKKFKGSFLFKGFDIIVKHTIEEEGIFT